MKQYIMLTVMLLCNFFALHAAKLKVVASASIFQDMAKQICGDLADVYTIVPIGSDPHLYEPTPSDATMLKEANVILINGLTFEGWITEVIQNSGTKALISTITEGIIPISSADHKGATDPHAWMDALNGLIYIDNIKDAVIKSDPKNKDQYLANYKIYREKLIELDQYIRKEMQRIPVKHRVLITSHDAFTYFGKRYGITLQAIMGISTESDAQTADIQRIIKSIRETGVPAVFIESTINPKMLKQIADDSKVVIGGELFADSIGDEKSNGNGYIQMLQHNAKTIANALSASSNSETKLDHDSKSNIWLTYGIVSLVLVLSLVYMALKLNSNHG